MPCGKAMLESWMSIAAIRWKAVADTGLLKARFHGTGDLGACPPGEFLDFKPSEIVTDDNFGVK